LIYAIKSCSNIDGRSAYKSGVTNLAATNKLLSLSKGHRWLIVPTLSEYRTNKLGWKS
jgi:hypothetical protein